jgi:cytochrome oxidase Cu insertion factor (SCO1/SenC/PrrC family)
MRNLAELLLAATLLATPKQACDVLAHADGNTGAAQVAAAIDVVRAQHASNAAEALVALLPHRSALFAGRDKDEVIRLRAYILATLADIGVPPSARPALLDILAHVDAGNSPLEVAAAAHAVATLGERGREFTPHLLTALGVRLSVEELSLARFEQDYPPSEATTAQLELVRALGRIAPADDRDLHTALEQVIDDPERDPRLVAEARRVLDRQAVAQADGPPLPSLASLWHPPAQRPRLQHLGIAYKDHDGRGGTLAQLVDRPVLITFFYSRCQNSKKCSMAVSWMAALQQQLAKAGAADGVRLLAVSYEPQVDTPERIHRFAADRGMQLGANALALQLDAKGEKRLLDELQAPVNFSAGWVNTHGVELSLLDAQGRIVRQYETTIWDNDQVVADVQRLLAER